VTAGLKEFLSVERQGVLATLSASREGWPFASLAPFALTEQGEPLLLLSDLAEHTRNLRVDARASLLVQDHTSLEDPQAGARVTLLGVVEPVETAVLDSMRARYVERHPGAQEYFAMGDFHLYVLRISQVRFIGGFGDMGWIDGEAVRALFH
jgi:putative heme iron utilization protein